MLRQFRISWGYIIAIIILALIGQASQAQSQSHEPTHESSQVSAETEVQLSATIKKQQKALKAQAADVASRLSAAKSSERTEEAELLQAELVIIDQIDTTYGQQSAALEKLQSLAAKNEHFREEIASLQAPSSKGQRISFMELDRVREELYMESRREKTMASEIKLADDALQQSIKIVQQKQDRLKLLEAVSGEADTVSVRSRIELEIARRDLELAGQVQGLRQLELRIQKQAKAVHQTHLELLRHQVKVLQAHAVFNPEDLQEQQQRIDKEEFELNRELSRAKDQRLTVKSRLEQARKKLAAAGLDGEKRMEMNLETLRLEFEELESKIATATRRLELLADWKEVWQRRYKVFNLMADQATLQEWRSAADLQLTQIDQDERTLRLSLADWQNRLITLNNKIENNNEVALGEEKTGYAQQRKHMLAIIDQLKGMQTAYENSRRLLTKLLDEINLRTSDNSWRDWIDLALNYKIYENILLDWTYALASALATFALLYFLRWILIQRLKHLEKLDKASLANGFLTSIKRANIFFFLMLAVSVASLFLAIDPGTSRNIASLTKVAFIFQTGVWGSSFLRIWIFNILARRTKRDGASLGALSIFNFSSQVILWSVALLLMLQNLGIDVTALIAGLGIGGVAVALSLQHILKDLFSSFSIVLDKPFVIGDFVIFDEFMGSIEHIGIKTTRIRSLTGEQIICPNGDLLNTRIRNFKRMNERRVSFNIGVVYQTPAEKLQQIPAMIREIIEAREAIRFDRSHFSSYSDFALLFENVYYVLSSDYNIYMDIQQTINLEIFKRFQAEGIEFAYPTQSLYLQSVSNHDQTIGMTKPALNR